MRTSEDSLKLELIIEHRDEDQVGEAAQAQPQKKRDVKKESKILE